MLKNEKKGQIYAFSALNRNLAENTPFFSFFSIFYKTIPQNGLNMIIRGWNEKIFGPKFLVPWDTPGVTGAPISGGCDLMIWPTLFSGHMGSMWPPRHSGTSCSSRNSENGWSMVWWEKGKNSLLRKVLLFFSFFCSTRKPPFKTDINTKT